MITVKEKPDLKRVSQVAIKIFVNITENEWSLAEHESRVLLGEPSRATYYNWKAGKVSQLNRDTLDRISYITGIYKSLHILFRLPEQANEWVKKQNTAFGGKSALDIMLSGGIMDLALVRRYLDAQRG